MKPHTYKFEDIVVDTGEFKVLRNDRPLQLERKAFEVLVYFLENSGRLVTKNELLDAVWSDSFVTQNALTRVVGQLRRVLDDDKQNPRFIETIPTRGYRFIARVDGTKGRPITQANVTTDLSDRSLKLSEANRVDEKR